MWGNYLASALGSLARSRLYAVINIVGLALGVSAALLIALFVGDGYSHDRFFPGYRDVYLLGQTKDPTDRRMLMERWDFSSPDVAAKLKLQLPQMESVARVMTSSTPPHLRRGQVEADETGFVWMDASFFEIMPLKSLAGDLKTALASPDGAVLTRSAARKYFGNDKPLGELLEVNPALGSAAGKISSAFNTPHAMRVTAIIEDLPSNSYLKGDVFGSSLAAYSKFSLHDLTVDQGPFRSNAYTFIRLKPGTVAQQVQEQLSAYAARNAQVYPPGFTVGLHLTPIGELHLSPPGAMPMSPRGDRTILSALLAIAALIVASASFNFVALMTARANQRAVETGVRKATGAFRGQLVVQYLAEAVIYVALAMVIAISLTELLLPQLNSVLKQKIAFHYLGNPVLLGVLLVATILLGLLAGAYPAFVLSSFRPIKVLKRKSAQGGGKGIVRKTLVGLQFAIMIGLTIIAATVWRQTLFSLNNQLRIDGSAILLVDNACAASGQVFRERLASVPGVAAATCASDEVLFNGGMVVSAQAQGKETPMVSGAVEFGALEFFGLQPLAGRFFDRKYGDDGRLMQGDAPGNPSVVLNETAVKALGFRSPAEAIGKVVTWNRRRPSTNPNAGTAGPSEIIGVAPDFALDTRREAYPQVIFVDPNMISMLSIRLSGSRIPEALSGIDSLWSQTMDKRIGRRFLSQKMQDMYSDIILQGTAISLGAALAVVIAALGLFGLSAHSAEERTKEIGVRRAMGASSTDVVRLMLGEFAQPVVWANLLAWPIAWWAMNQWLSGFANHVDLPPWLFLASGGAALVIASLTVLHHALAVAGDSPSKALRYE